MGKRMTKASESGSPRNGVTGRASKHVLLTMYCVDAQERWLWSSALAVTILAAIGMISLARPTLFANANSFSSFFLGHPVVFLFGLVLVFNICVLHKQMRIRQTRHELSDQLYELSVLDPLTGLFNRRYVEHRLEEEIARCQRSGSPLTVILFDLDGLKQINDSYGHGAGDEVLRAFAERLKAATRGSDVAARYGGDEFLLVLAECRHDGVQYVLKRLRDLHIKAKNKRLPISCSAGWAGYVLGESLTEVLKRADAALYSNKRKVAASRSDKVSQVPVT